MEKKKNAKKGRSLPFLFSSFEVEEKNRKFKEKKNP